MAKRYKPRKGSHGISKKQAQVYGNYLHTLMAKKGGELTPNEIIEDASRGSSPIHSFFEWDDTTAAIKYRQQQARYLMACVVVDVKLDGANVETRTFFNVKNDEKQTVYVTFETA